MEAWDIESKKHIGKGERIRGRVWWDWIKNITNYGSIG